MSLPYDYDRCAGATFTVSDDEGGYAAFRSQCINCLRRTSPGRDEWQSYIAPHAGPGPCPSRIGEGE